MKLFITVASLLIAFAIAMQPPKYSCDKQRIETFNGWTKNSYWATLENCVANHDPNGSNNLENIDIMMKVKVDGVSPEDQFYNIADYAVTYDKLGVLKHCVEADQGLHYIDTKLVGNAAQGKKIEILEYFASLGSYAYQTPVDVVEILAEVPDKGKGLLEMFVENSEPIFEPKFIIDAALHNISHAIKLAEQLDLSSVQPVKPEIEPFVETLGKELSKLIAQGQLGTLPIRVMEKLITKNFKKPEGLDGLIELLTTPIDESKQTQQDKDLCAAFKLGVPSQTYQFKEIPELIEILKGGNKAIKELEKKTNQNVDLKLVVQNLLVKHIVPAIQALKLPEAIDEVVGKDYSTANPETLKRLKLLVGPLSLASMMLTKVFPVYAQHSTEATYKDNIAKAAKAPEALQNLIKLQLEIYVQEIMNFIGEASLEADRKLREKINEQLKKKGLAEIPNLSLKQRASIKSFDLRDLVKIHNEYRGKKLSQDFNDALGNFTKEHCGDVKESDFKRDLEDYIVLELIKLIGVKMDIILAPFINALVTTGAGGIQISSSGGEDEVIDLDEENVVETAEAPNKPTEASKTETVEGKTAETGTSAASSFSYGASTVVILACGAAAVLL